MKITHVLVAAALMTAGLPAAAAPSSAEQPSEAPSDAADRLIDDAPAVQPDDAPAANRDGWVVPEDVEPDGGPQMHVATAAAIGGATAGVMGVGGMALYVMTGGIALMAGFGPHNSPAGRTALAMFYAAPLVFGALTLGGALVAGGLTWTLSDTGAGATIAAAFAAGLGVLIGIPLAALGVVFTSLATIGVGLSALPFSVAIPVVSGGLLLSAALPVAVVAATVAGATSVAGFGGHLIDDAITAPAE